MNSVLVVGTGLIGTSFALALRAAGVPVFLSDTDASAAQLAADMGAGELFGGSSVSTSVSTSVSDSASASVDLAVLAVPPSAVAGTLFELQSRGTARFYTDVASVKQLPVSAAVAAGCDMTSYVPGHPLAGREKHGPAAARADLFLGRSWALCPGPSTSSEAVACVTALVTACGAVPVITDPATHDRWVALVSHAPHVVAAAMASRLEHADDAALSLAGQGLRDVTRVAAGDTALWTQILTANAFAVAAVLDAVAADLAEAARLLADGSDSGFGSGSGPGSGSGEKVAALLEAGQVGVARIPGKHGGVAREFNVVQVVIRDEPGELSRLFAAVGAARVNIEDIRIEHSPGLPVGVAELSVRPAEAAALLSALDAGGWPARQFS